MRREHPGGVGLGYFTSPSLALWLCCSTHPNGSLERIGAGRGSLGPRWQADPKFQARREEGCPKFQA